MEYYTGEQAFRDPAIMDRIHKCGQEILDVFVGICEEHELKYYLAGGSLLGAVRHKGPIPWDDDIDVYMPRADFDAFKKLMLERPESETYHIQCLENEPTFAHFNVHFNKSGTLYKTEIAAEKKRRYMELWIDVFPLDECRGDMTTVWGRLIGKYLMSFKYELTIRAKLIRKAPSLRHRAAQLLFKPLSDDRLWRLTDRLMRRDNGKRCDHYANWTGRCPFPANIMPKSWFEPACKLLYNGKYYWAPGEWDKVLTQRYGDYMQLPPEDQRITGFPIEIGL